MKRILFLLLAIAIGLSLIGCQKYEPQKSSALESTPVIELRYEKEDYEVNYELFRMAFLSAKEVVSGGDLTKFEGAEAEALLEAAQRIALDRVFEIYSVFALCDAIGIDLYASEVDDKVEESIELSVEGGYTETGVPIDGIGSYEKYLESLKLFYANYAVQELLIRYSYGLSAIDAYYRGSYDEHGILDEEGKLSYTDEDVTDYYNSSETRRILLAFTMKDEDKIAELFDQIALLSDEDEIGRRIITSTTGNDVDTRLGLVIGRHSWNNDAYAELTEAAFALEEGEITAVKGKMDGYDGHFILYRARKSADNLAANREKTEELYVKNEVGKRYADVKAALEKSAVYTDFYKQLTFAAISMDEEKK